MKALLPDVQDRVALGVDLETLIQGQRRIETKLDALSKALLEMAKSMITRGSL